MEKELITKIKKYFKSVPIQRAWLFGSFARGEENNNSDVDLIVEFIPNQHIGLKYFKIIDDLENLCNRKIDLTEERMIDQRILKYVSNDKILIYETF